MSLKDIISTNKYVGDLNGCRDLQNEATFYISFDTTNPHLDSVFKPRIKEIYAGEKYKCSRFFNAFAGQMLPSLELTETIYSNAYRVWDSGDPVNEVNFKDRDLHDEALTYVKNFDKWWLKDYWEAYKHQFCSFIVVDLPEIQSTPRPEPYPFILNVEDVLYIKPTKDKKVDEIIFQSIETTGENESKKYYYHYTSEFYSKYLIDGEEEELLLMSPHNLKRCPVHKVWNEMLNKKSWLLTKSLITPSFEDIFWYNVKTIESRKADLLYLNPTRQMPKLSCGYNTERDNSNRYKTEFGKAKCVGGWLFTLDGKSAVLDGSGDKMLCPVCGKSRHSGGGAGNEIIIDLDAQAIKDGKVNISDALMQFITPDIEGVNVQYQRVTELESRITKHCIGSDEQPTKSALNELQQHAIFESKESVLKRISKGISKVITDVEKDMLELRYPDSFISNNYNQGTKFYLYEVSELLEMRDKAKNPIQKKQIDEQIIEVKYRNNPKKLDEEKLLYKLLPYNTLTDEEFNERIDNRQIINSEAIGLRLQFSNAIELFESEFGSIIEFFTYKFNEKIPENKRIEIIRDELIRTIKIDDYVQDQVSQ
jgi:hypothetical protein